MWQAINQTMTKSLGEHEKISSIKSVIEAVADVYKKRQNIDNPVATNPIIR